MNIELRESVQSVAKKSLPVIEGCLSGDNMDIKRLTTALRVLGFGIKIESMNQMKDKDDKSAALRLMNFLPNDPGMRAEYIRITFPQVATILKSPNKQK